MSCPVFPAQSIASTAKECEPKAEGVVAIELPKLYTVGFAAGAMGQLAGTLPLHFAMPEPTSAHLYVICTFWPIKNVLPAAEKLWLMLGACVSTPNSNVGKLAQLAVGSDNCGAEGLNRSSSVRAQSVV